MRELWSDVDTFVAARWDRSLPLQRLWSLLQDERPEPAAHQTQAQIGKRKYNQFSFFSISKL